MGVLESPVDTVSNNALNEFKNSNNAESWLVKKTLANTKLFRVYSYSLTVSYS